MTTTPRHPDSLTTGHPMIDRAEAEATLYRVAVSAFTYYPEKPDVEAGYGVEEDVDWCSAPLISLPSEQFDALRETIRELITSPTADRRAFIATLDELAGQ
jgi:hypothetical protein